MSPTDNGSTTGEVESRLDHLFGKTQDPDDSGDLENSPIRELKSTILSIDWEISDGILTKLIEDIDKLEDPFSHDKDLLLFLKLIGSLGKYIKKNKVNAHPSAIKLLNSTYNSLEKVMVSKDITSSEKRQLLLAQVDKFKKLNEELTHKKTDAPDKKGAKTAGKAEPAVAEHGKDENLKAEKKPAGKSEQVQQSDMSRMSPQEALDYVLQEVRETIRAEFKALREDLKKSLGL